MTKSESQINLQELKKEIPYQWRVQSFSKFKPSATCVAYIDARDAMNLLDDVVGAGNWQDDYKVINQQMFAGVGIKVNGEWVWKWDTGTDSETEKEKGRVSDSFKRACVKWGIGRFLYDLDIQYLDANEVKTSTNKPFCIDKNKKRIWDLTTYINATYQKTSIKDYDTQDEKTIVDMHRVAIQKLNTVKELIGYLNKHEEERNIITPLLAERKKEILSNQF